MGEEDLSQKIGYFSRADCIVIWNLEDYPIPLGADLCTIRRDIEEALEQMGFYGATEIHAFGDQLKDHWDELWKAVVFSYLPETSTGDNSAAFQMPSTMINCAQEPSTFLVIAKQSPESELHRVLQCLESRNHTVLVVVDDTAQVSPVHSVQSLVECTQLLGGGKPISKEPQEDASSQFYNSKIEDISKIEEHIYKIEEDIYKIEDFSKRCTPFKGYRTVVFWDVVDCPFPLCSDPNMIYHKFDKALSEVDSIGHMSIWAYVDENNGSWSGEYLRKKTWETRIYFLPGGASRHNRMLNDMLLWVSDSLEDGDRQPTNLIVVSTKFREHAYFFGMLSYLNKTPYYKVLLVSPPQHLNKPESPEWPGLLLDEVYVFDRPLSESSEPCPKKHKPDAGSESSEPCPKKHKPDAGSGDQG